MTGSHECKLPAGAVRTEAGIGDIGFCVGMVLALGWLVSNVTKHAWWIATELTREIYAFQLIIG